jgi:hypothetical protein
MPSIKTLRHQEVLFGRLFEELTQLRIDEPERVVQLAQKRKKRPRLTADGKLSILAADQPARKMLKVADNPMALADRQEFLTRIIRIASADVVDGIASTIDVLEELLLMHELMQAQGLPAFLNNKLLIVTLNRGWTGVEPAAELLSGPSASQCVAWKLDGVRAFWRGSQDPGSRTAMHDCAQALALSNEARLPFFVELLPPTGAKLDERTYRSWWE